MATANGLYQPQSGDLTVQYAPSGQTELIENPPRFTWIPAKLEDDRYVLEVSSAPDFTGETTRTYGPVPYNFFTPSEALGPGTYYWRYALLEGEGPEAQQSEWSTVREFRVPEGLPETALPSRSERYSRVRTGHPRLWLQPDELEAYRGTVREDAAGSGWQVLYAIRHLSVAGAVLQDAELLAKAKAWLLHAASWDPDGPTSRDYNDEAAFRIAAALAWGYDWLHGELTEDEREAVREPLLARTRQVAYHVIQRSKIHHVPYDSHAVRSLSSVLVPCCIALFDEEPEAREWLDYTVEYYYTLFSPWGGKDGGWAEGPHYWTTGMAYLTEGLNLLKNFSGLDVFRRPFFQRTGDFPLYCYSPTTSTRTAFGDNSTLGDDIIKK
ncbi:hypothetical protein BGX30_002607, partial [Mortierella sp. GBA39]